MRDCAHHIEVSREEAVELMLERSGFLEGIDKGMIPEDRCEWIRIEEAYGRVLARPAKCLIPSPNCTIASLDSVVVKWEAFASDKLPDVSDWVQGEDWEFVNTGRRVPEGFDAAVVVEHCEFDENNKLTAINLAPSAQYAGLRFKGSRVDVEDLIAEAGQVIDSDLLPRLAGAGINMVCVARKPKVVFIPTGNELQALGNTFVVEGMNLETNSLMTKTKVESWQGDYVALPIVLDKKKNITEALDMALGQADIVVLNAGSSKGSDDWSVEVLEDSGEVLYHQVNHGPGHHCFSGVVDGRVVVGISGPPQGASFSLDFFLRPLMMAWLGLDWKPKYINAILARDFDKKRHRDYRKITGEIRPRTEVPQVGVKAIYLELTPEATIKATPLPGRLGHAGTEKAQALYLMPIGDKNSLAPKVGDIIQVELREPTLLRTTKSLRGEYLGE